MLDALELVARYARREHLTYYPAGETIPAHAGLDGDWRALAYTQDGRGRQRVLRMIYEIATFQALRDQLRCKEIWVVGADRWRNPDEDLPPDFEQRRGEHYKALRSRWTRPSSSTRSAPDASRAAALHEALPELPFLEIADRGKQGAIKLTPLKAQPDPREPEHAQARHPRRAGGWSR